jgi:hypothetical protein
MTNHNGYVLEQLYSPLVVVTTPAHEELLRLGKGCITPDGAPLRRVLLEPREKYESEARRTGSYARTRLGVVDASPGANGRKRSQSPRIRASWKRMTDASVYLSPTS